MKKRAVFVIAAVVLTVAAVVVFLQRKPENERRTPAVEFSVNIERDDVLGLISDKSDIPGLSFISSFIPENINIVCRAELTGEGEVPIRIAKVSVNGQEIPYELYENYLDFSCSLVYN